MRYLAVAELEQLNALLSSVESDDGSRITGRLEAYSCKAAGADKKLRRRLEMRFHPTENAHDALTDSNEEFPCETLLSSSPPTGGAGDALHGMDLKLFYYLVATMNQVFPDYDFSDLKPEVFTPQTPLSSVVHHVNTTLFNTGVNKSVVSFNEFSGRMWERIDSAIGLSEVEVYSFAGDSFDELDDPFWERGCIWSFNYFFWSRKLKRVLLFTCRAVSTLVRDSENFLDERLSQRSTTPMPSTL